MESKEEAKALIKQYTEEIESMKPKLEVAKIMLNDAKEEKKRLRPSARGRIADNDWDTRMAMAQCDCEISRYECEVAMYKNQIKLRKEEVARLKKIK
mgnify:CR=1 FL=1